MRRIHERGPDARLQQAFDAWLNGPAATATAAVCGAANAHRKVLMKTNEPVYKKLRDYLLWLFYEKCAYCETDFRSARVQIDHFRPKSGVTGQGQHPGYYWLMFAPSNLLPSCSLCNRNKSNCFPVRGKRAIAPGDDLAQELPELLNPYADDDIASHITFVTDESDPLLFGVAKEISNSRRGQQSIEGYGLNEDAKVRGRQMEMKAFMREFKDAFENPARRAELLTSLQEGRRPFSAACEAKVKAWLDSLSRELVQHLGGRIQDNSPGT